jgi:SAM-dependent methyltransferase
MGVTDTFPLGGLHASPAGYRPAGYGDAFADVYDDWYADISDTEGTVATIADLAGGGRVLELGVGTGRLAIPLARLGLEVHGVDASAAMVDRLLAKPGSRAVTVTVGDFGEELPTGPFHVVFAAFNTFFNLTSADAQRRCVGLVAERLAPGGHLVIEAFVPEMSGPVGDAAVGRPRDEWRVEPTALDGGQVVLQITRHDRAAQLVDGQHVTISPAGFRVRPWSIRYLSPTQLDDLAGAAGLELVRRREGWRNQPFDDLSLRHVSVYRRRTG